MKAVVWVGIGGGLGSICRYLASVLVQRYFQTVFPLATWGVNILGCLLAGLLLGLFERHRLADPVWRLFFLTGFCGGYTTFSAFAAENIRLLQNGHFLIALLYIAGSIIAGLLAVGAGIWLAR